MSLTCQQIRPLLDAYLTNELLVETLQSVNEHLNTCAGCRAALESRQRARTAVRATVRSLMPEPGFADLIRDAVRAEAAPRSWFQRPSIIWLAAAAAALVLATFFGLQQWRTDTALILARLGLGKGDHVFCARGGFYPDVPPTPAEMREQVGAPYAQLVDRVISQSQGYVIREGHLCNWEEREFVHFILERDKKLVSVMLTAKKRPDEVFPRHSLLAAMRAQGIPVYTTEDDGMSIAGLDAGRHLAFAVSERGSAEGLRLLTALAPSLSTIQKP